MNSPLVGCLTPSLPRKRGGTGVSSTEGSKRHYGREVPRRLSRKILPGIATALFEILEIQRLIDGEVTIEIIPPGNELLAQMQAAGKTTVEGKKPRPESPAEIRLRPRRGRALPALIVAKVQNYGV